MLSFCKKKSKVVTNQDEDLLVYILFINRIYVLLTNFIIYNRIDNELSICRPPRYNWNIVESGIKHHKNQSIYIICFIDRIYELLIEFMFYWQTMNY